MTGNLLWSQTVDSNHAASLTGAPVIYNHKIFVTASSHEEAVTTPGYIPSFRGSISALDEATGAILWTFTTVPQGYTGGGISGSAVLDPQRNSVYVATGNNYTIPATAAACVVQAGTSMIDQVACLDPTDYFESILALDITTGALKWSRRTSAADVWTKSCNPPRNVAACPDPVGADFDFIAAPNLMSPAGFVGAADDRGGTAKGALLGAGQKSGVYWALNPDNGGIFWATFVGPGPIQWGTAVDVRGGSRILVATANDRAQPFTLVGRNGHSQAWKNGAWAALDAIKGTIVWQIPSYGMDLQNPANGSTAYAPVSTSNFVAFAGSSSGYMVAFSTASGLVDWTFQSGGNVMGAPAIFNDTLFWGTGYRGTAATTPRLFAFAVPAPVSNAPAP